MTQPDLSGFVLVPRELSPELLRAMMTNEVVTNDEHRRFCEAACRESWRSVLSARPSSCDELWQAYRELEEAAKNDHPFYDESCQTCRALSRLEAAKGKT